MNSNEVELTERQKEKLKERITEKVNRILSEIIDMNYPSSPKFEDISGQWFNDLYVNSYIGKTIEGNKSKIWYHCTCRCGNDTICDKYSLTHEIAKSCGCYSIKAATKCGFSNNPKYKKLYKCLSHMRDRCYNPKDRSYPEYGGRGIKICDEWMIAEDYQGLQNFINWAYNESNYENGLTIERIDVDGNYCPENCIWITKSDQAMNMRQTHYIQIDRWVLPMTCWAKITGKKVTTIANRINYYGWDPIDAVLITALPPRSEYTPGMGPRLDMLVIPPEYERFNKYDEFVQKGIITPVEETVYKGVIT